MKNEKLTEATILALQGKLVENNTYNDKYVYRFVGGKYDRGYDKEYTKAEAEKLPILQPQTTGENPGVRDELKNQLKFKGYLGPMFDGYTDDGKAIIRYETSEVYNQLSENLQESEKKELTYDEVASKIMADKIVYLVQYADPYGTARVDIDKEIALELFYKLSDEEQKKILDEFGLEEYHKTFARTK